MMLSWITGIALILSAVFCGAQHMLVSPREDRWANRPAWYRAILFIFTVGLTFLGLRFVSVALAGETSVPPAASIAITILSLLLGLYLFGVLVSVWTRQAWNERIAELLRRPETQPTSYLNPHRPRLTRGRFR